MRIKHIRLTRLFLVSRREAPRGMAIISHYGKFRLKYEYYVRYLAKRILKWLQWIISATQKCHSTPPPNPLGPPSSGTNDKDIKQDKNEFNECPSRRRLRFIKGMIGTTISKPPP